MNSKTRANPGWPSDLVMTKTQDTKKVIRVDPWTQILNKKLLKQNVDGIMRHTGKRLLGRSVGEGK